MSVDFQRHLTLFLANVVLCNKRQSLRLRLLLLFLKCANGKAIKSADTFG